MTSPLERLGATDSGLHVEAPDPDEIKRLTQSGETRLADAKKETNALESRFDLAYNAAHAMCLAALRRAGYRSDNRYLVFQVVPHTLGLGPDVWRVLAKCHELRNRCEYEGDTRVDERVVKDLIAACDKVRAALGTYRAHI